MSDEPADAEPRITFVVPPASLGGLDLPAPDEPYQHWQNRAVRRFGSIGRFNWTIQTALELRQAGLDVGLADRPPDQGVAIAHRDLLPMVFPGPRQLFVCLQADRAQPHDAGRHPYAQFHLVQNPADPLVRCPRPSWPAAFVPYWPQPGLLRRRETRGDTVERLAYFGIAKNLAPEIRDPAFGRWLAERSLEFEIVPAERWADYREVDVVVAVRSFDPSRRYDAKPASKLINGWLAGVPAIVGVESAYRALRTDPADYLEVDTFASLQATIERLRSVPSLYPALRRRATERAADQGSDRVRAAWVALLTGPIRSAWVDWCRQTPTARLRFRVGRWLERWAPRALGPGTHRPLR